MRRDPDELLSLDDDEPSKSRGILGLPLAARLGILAVLIAIILIVLALVIVAIRGKTRVTESGKKPSESSVVVSARITPPDVWTKGDVLVSMGEVMLMDDDLYLVACVECTNPNRSFTFRSWRRSGNLTDDLGNKYQYKNVDTFVDGLLAQRWNETAAAKRLGYGAGPVYSEKGRTEFLVWQRPVTNADYLDLDLDAKHVGQSGMIRFRLPSTMWKDTPPPKK